MKQIILFTLGTIFFSGCSNQGSNHEQYGDPITLVEKTSIQSILEDPQNNKGEEFLIAGNITSVCQKKGCWMTIAEDSVEMFIRFKDYGFFMPKDGFGLLAQCQGIYSNEMVLEKNEGGEEIESLSHLFTASGVTLTKE
ncbi:MAG: DUF4920 domain-containing protein [Candidatus Marinimicrobia bacterium]|jgi:hypothetical protein|nr:DUF4920 domain-containing protein [Candidatus Neomarinimicrobiota bacterium]